MSKVIRTALSLVVSLLLFSALAMAQPGGNTDKDKNKDKNKEHHSRLSKVAFWRHHKDADHKKTKSHAPSKHAQAKPSQIKPASAKQAAGHKDQKQEQHAGNTPKAASHKASAANKPKPQPKPKEDSKTASLSD